MIIINEANTKFIKKHISNSNDILEAENARDALVKFSSWINRCDECWDSTGYFYSELGRQAQRVYDDILYDNVYVDKQNA